MAVFGQRVMPQYYVLIWEYMINVKSTDHLHVYEIGQNHLPVDATSEKYSGIKYPPKNIHFLTEPSKQVKQHV